MNSKVIICSFILQTIALAGAILLALIYDGYWLYLGYACIGTVLGINLAAIIPHKKDENNWRP